MRLAAAMTMGRELTAPRQGRDGVDCAGCRSRIYLKSRGNSPTGNALGDKRWRHDGGQAILTLRALEQSDRFDRAWRMLAATYVSQVRLPDNIVDLASRRPR